MTTQFRLRPLILLGTTAAVLIGGTLADAQTIRPGGNARGVNRATGGTGAGVGRAAGGTGTTGTGPRQYRSNTLLGDAVIQIDPETRSLVIVTDEETHEEMQKVILDLDRPKPQVLIKVVFLEVTYDKGLDLGVEGTYTFNLKNSNPGSTGETTTTTTQTRSTDNGGTRTVATEVVAPAGQAAGLGQTINVQSLFGLAALRDGSFVRVVADDWSATLRALATKGKLEVLSRPSIMARNNQEAVIVVGQEVPFVTNSRVTDNGQTINTIQYDNVGIILRVTPFITSKNTVEMIVAPEISNLTNQTVQISDTVSSPVISKRSAETVVVTPNGATAVIGGLMETQKLEAIRKIPLLGDIPYLGAAFRRVVKNDVKRELLIFLTPFIVNDPETVQRTTHAEVENTELVQRAFSEKDFEKFFDQQDTGKRYREAMVDGGIPIDGARPVADVVAPATVASPVVSQKTTTTQTTTKKPTPKATTKPKTKAPATKQD